MPEKKDLTLSSKTMSEARELGELLERVADGLKSGEDKQVLVEVALLALLGGPQDGADDEPTPFAVLVSALIRSVKSEIDAQKDEVAA